MKEYNMIIMTSEELNRDVRIYISLPENYHNSNDSYPVLYMNDGEVVFKDYDGYQGTNWGIMDKLMNNPKRPEVILVGISSGPSRNNELLPFTFTRRNSEETLGGEANVYMDFIVNKLMPIINSKYRTITSEEETGMLGMSVGGVTAMYAATNYSSIFGRIACISSAFIPVHKKMLEHIEKSDLTKINKLYVDIGTNESPNEQGSLRYLSTNKEVNEVLKTKLNKESYQFHVIDGAKHEEEDWSERFPNIISFLYGSNK